MERWPEPQEWLKDDVPEITQETKPDRFPTSIFPLSSSLTAAIFVWSGKDRQAIRIMVSKSVLESFVFKAVSLRLNITIYFPLLMKC